MADYIEREAALRFQDELEPVICKSVETGALFSATKDADLTSYLDALPAADVRPVRYGKWVKRNGAILCSECNYDTPFIVRNFCPNCGANMRGGEPHE